MASYVTYVQIRHFENYHPALPLWVSVFLHHDFTDETRVGHDWCLKKIANGENLGICNKLQVNFNLYNPDPYKVYDPYSLIVKIYQN